MEKGNIFSMIIFKVLLTENEWSSRVTICDLRERTWKTP